MQTLTSDCRKPENRHLRGCWQRLLEQQLLACFCLIHYLNVDRGAVVLSLILRYLTSAVFSRIFHLFFKKKEKLLTPIFGWTVPWRFSAPASKEELNQSVSVLGAHDCIMRFWDLRGFCAGYSATYSYTKHPSLHRLAERRHLISPKRISARDNWYAVNQFTS